MIPQVNPVVIATAQVECNKLCAESFLLLHQISQKPERLKLLSLARNHLKVLAEYEAK